MNVNGVNWHDSYLDKISIEFDKCLIELTDYNDKYRIIMCHKFGSINYIGQYDENVIKNMRIVTDSKFIEETRRVIKENNSNYIDRDLRQLEIELIDGVKIRIVANNFEIH